MRRRQAAWESSGCGLIRVWVPGWSLPRLRKDLALGSSRVSSHQRPSFLDLLALRTPSLTVGHQGVPWGDLSWD